MVRSLRVGERFWIYGSLLRREMAVGNTFGATALSSYGGFWIGTAIILTPGGFEIIADLETVSAAPFNLSFGLYLMVSCLAPLLDFEKRFANLDSDRAGSSLPPSC